MHDLYHLPHGHTASIVPSSEAATNTSAREETAQISDISGSVHALISIRGNQVVGITEAQELSLSSNAREAVEAYLAMLDYPLMCSTHAIGDRVMDASGVFHDLNALPDTLHLRGWLFLVRKKGVRLPTRSLTVDGSLYLGDCMVDTFPSEHLSVSEDANFHGSNIITFPKGTFVGGDLILAAETSSLPEGLRVGRHLRLGHTQVKAVPEGTICDGRLMFNHEQFETVPASIPDERWVCIYSGGDDGRVFQTSAKWYRHRTDLMEERRMLRERIATRSLPEKVRDFLLWRPSPQALLRQNHDRSYRLSMCAAD